MPNAERHRQIYVAEIETFKKTRALRKGSYDEFDSLEDLITVYILSLLREADMEFREGRTKSQFKHHFLIIEGPPSAGKTFLGRKIKRHAVDRIKRLTRGLGRKVKIRLGDKSWEEDGEERARDLGMITTPRDQPFSEKELESATEELERSVVESTQENEATIVEVPGGVSSTLLEGRWIGRQLGAKMLYNLQYKQGNFKNLPDYEVFHAGLSGGPLLRHVAVPFREDFRNAATFDEAQYINKLYGKEPLLDEEDWLSKRVEGASESQIIIIEHWISSLAILLQDSKLISVPLGRQKSLANALQVEVLRNTIDLQGSLKRRSTRAIAVSKIMEDFFSRVLEIDKGHAFVGYNNPGSRDLNIPNMKHLSSHIYARGSLRISTGRLLFYHVPEPAYGVE